MRRRAVALLCVAALAAAAHRVEGQNPAGASPSEVRLEPVATSALLAPHPVVRKALERILARSARFRDGLEQVSNLGRHVLVLTTDQVAMTSGRAEDSYALDDSELAEAVAVADPDSVIRTVVVVLNLDLVQRVARELSLSDRDLADDIDRILIHEVYSHAVPLLIEGRPGRCSDPEEGQPAIEACSIRRENEVRADAGLGLRTDYGLRSLALGRRLER